MRRILLYLTIFISSASIALAQGNERPEAVSIPDTVIMSLLPYEFELSAVGSTDADGSIESYYWVVNNTDTVANTETATLTVESKTTKVRLIVVDDEGENDREDFNIFIGHPTNNDLNRIPFRNGTLPIFVTGMNIAWNRYADDLTSEFDEEAENYFIELMDSVSNNGGNSLRWWIHTNGFRTPFVEESGHVTGIDLSAIQNMKHVLDLAFDRGISISMCLWSFDMLQHNQGQDFEAMKLLLEDTENIQSYIDNALVPILDLLGDHPAVLTWEIFNEPEGMSRDFGWTTGGKVSMSTIQRFVNMTSGAIHRAVPQALVSNGSWSFRANTDINGNKNYYSNEELIAAGGDQDGVLDFYQIHYYPLHSGNSVSPFHRPADHWELDKPIVIGEFPADVIDGNARPNYTVEEAYELAVKYGYAGAMSWSWSSTSSFNSDFSGTTARGLRKVKSMIPDELEISNDAISINRIPKVLSPIQPYRSLIEKISSQPEHFVLTDAFTDDQPSSELKFEVDKNENSAIVTVSIDEGVVGYSFPEPSVGMSEITIKATDFEDWYAESSTIVMIGSTEGQEDNLAYFKPIRSSTENNTQFDIYVNDGNEGSYWESEDASEQWLEIDFEENINFNFVYLNWSTSFSNKFKIQTSSDQENWETVFETESGSGREEGIVFDESNARYQRLVIPADNNVNQFSIDEIEVSYIPDNEAPTVINQVDSHEVLLSEVRSINNYVRFENLFSDLEHPNLLKYEIDNSNSELLLANFSAGRTGVSLQFKSNAVGSAIITLTATDPFGASASVNFEVKVIDDLLSVRDDQTDFTIYPNPIEDIVSINLGEKIKEIRGFQLYDAEGRKVQTRVLNARFFQIDMTSLEAGIYFLSIQSSEGSHITKLIKK
ncbi:MAG: discoidin domain-containing protein [Cyclobacteriaceae bacterium]